MMHDGLVWHANIYVPQLKCWHFNFETYILACHTRNHASFVYCQILTSLTVWARGSHGCFFQNMDTDVNPLYSSKQKLKVELTRNSATCTRCPNSSTFSMCGNAAFKPSSGNMDRFLRSFTPYRSMVTLMKNTSASARSISQHCVFNLCTVP